MAKKRPENKLFRISVSLSSMTVAKPTKASMFSRTKDVTVVAQTLLLHKFVIH